MKLKTYQFRVKDSSSGKHLSRMANSVNFVWNYCNEANRESILKNNKNFSAFDLNGRTAGCSKDLGVHSQTVQAVCEEFAKSFKEAKSKCRNKEKVKKLNWRSSKKSLGWVPFKTSGIKLYSDYVEYAGFKFKFWKSADIKGVIRFGSFAQNSKKQWFINFVVEDDRHKRMPTGDICGIDLGLKTLITLSDGVSFTRESCTKIYAEKLANAQRAKKNKIIIKIHTKIKNKRKDWNHKVSSGLVTQYDYIAVGNVSSSRLKQTKMAKSVSDASWSDFKRMLKYKAIALGSEFKEVNESFSTVTCSVCKGRTGPKAVHGLKVREWVCLDCGEKHQRDVNAAKNILTFSLRGI